MTFKCQSAFMLGDTSRKGLFRSSFQFIAAKKCQGQLAIGIELLVGETLAWKQRGSAVRLLASTL